MGLQIAMQAPERVLGLIVQNANAHRTGWGSGWAATKAYWSRPNRKNEARATAHLTLDGTRDTYLSGVPPDVAEQIPAEHWEEDWRVMNLRDHMETLLETRAAAAVSLMLDFIRRTARAQM